MFLLIADLMIAHRTRRLGQWLISEKTVVF